MFKNCSDVPSLPEASHTCCIRLKSEDFVINETIRILFNFWKLSIIKTKADLEGVEEHFLKILSEFLADQKDLCVLYKDLCIKKLRIPKSDGDISNQNICFSEKK